MGGGGCRGWDVLGVGCGGGSAGAPGGRPPKAESSTMAAAVCPSFLVAEAEQSNELDSSASSQLKSGKTLWKVSSAGVLKMPETPGITCFS